MDNVDSLIASHINRLNALSSLVGSNVRFEQNDLSIMYNPSLDSLPDNPYAFMDLHGIFAEAFNKVLNLRRDELLKEICSSARDIIIASISEEVNRLKDLSKVLSTETVCFPYVPRGTLSG